MSGTGDSGRDEDDEFETPLEEGIVTVNVDVTVSEDGREAHLEEIRRRMPIEELDLADSSDDSSDNEPFYDIPELIGQGDLIPFWLQVGIGYNHVQRPSAPSHAHGGGGDWIPPEPPGWDVPEQFIPLPDEYSDDEGGDADGESLAADDILFSDAQEPVSPTLVEKPWIPFGPFLVPVPGVMYRVYRRMTTVMEEWEIQLILASLYYVVLMIGLMMFAICAVVLAKVIDDLKLSIQNTICEYDTARMLLYNGGSNWCDFGQESEEKLAELAKKYGDIGAPELLKELLEGAAFYWGQFFW